MTNKLDIFNKTQLKENIPDIRPGDVVRVHLNLPEKTKAGSQRTQAFEGLVIARKHGKGSNATFTVRKISLGVGVERIFPLHCPTIFKIEVVKRSKVRRAKLYYMRERRGKKARMKTKELLGVEWSASAKASADKEEPKKEAPTPAKGEAGVPTSDENRSVGKKPKEEAEKKEEKTKEEKPKEEKEKTK